MQRGGMCVRLVGTRGQGATEYLLILAVVLVVVATVVSFLLATRPLAIAITGLAEKNGDNIVFTPSTTMTPASIPHEDWEYAVYRGASKVYPVDTDWKPGTATLERGTSIALVATGVQSGDVLKIRYREKDVFSTNIS